MSWPVIRADPRDPGFVRNPYAFYAELHAMGGLAEWEEYGAPVAGAYRAVSALLRDRRFGRENPFPETPPARLAPFYDIEAHSMLEREPPAHSRLRGLVIRAFTSRAVAALAPRIERLAHDLIDRFPDGPFDLVPAFCAPIPVAAICELLGAPAGDAPRLLAWSHAMVAMYQIGRTRADEDAAAAAASAFAAYISAVLTARRATPSDDLISALIAAEAEGDRLSTAEMVSTCILLLNAGHEATVNALGAGVAALLAHPAPAPPLFADEARAARAVEEILRFEPPVHLFTRYAMEDVEVFGRRFARGETVALLLGAAGRDPAHIADPDRFDPDRTESAHLAFGAGIHFCVGAALARLEMKIALRALFARAPDLRLARPVRFADVYHFRAPAAVMVETGPAGLRARPVAPASG